MSATNLKGVGIEFHILQSFPVTCLNRDDVGAPKSALVGGVPRARVSSQCWKRQVRLALHDLGLSTGIRTKRVADMIADACRRLGASEEQARACGDAIGAALTDDTLFFIAPQEVERLAAYAAETGFVLPLEQAEGKKGKKADENAAGKTALPKSEKAKIKKCLSFAKSAADGLDIALFGRMVAQEPALNVQAAAAFAHALSTHKVVNEVEFFTALDDYARLSGTDEASVPGSSHMGTLEYNAATYYRYISLDLGQLWENLGGDDIPAAVDAFVKALYLAVPAARQSTQSGACPWDYARILVRRGQRMQLSFEKPVQSRNDSGWLAPSVKALDDGLARQEQLAGSLYGKIADIAYGGAEAVSIDAVREALRVAVTELAESAQ
ncbi:type I-E CRISPR-associated protein Cas7/Cse4/CasC [Desulfovibrio piger]|nr:type I-E CRISPR-associated protein Cas7/Cse4/CasC [Desulfovibrio piger]